MDILTTTLLAGSMLYDVVFEIWLRGLSETTMRVGSLYFMYVTCA